MVLIQVMYDKNTCSDLRVQTMFIIYKSIKLIVAVV